jgi:Cu2+-exporting ATPase
VGSETALAQIVELVRRAQNSKAPAQRLADRAAEWLVLAAVGAGVATFLIWFFVVGQTALFALTLAVTAIVIACPDALGLATPTAVAVGTGIGARNGILIKNATALEQLSRIRAIIFDKTGTLTEGSPVVTDVVVFAAGRARELDDAGLLRLAASVERDSEHPLAKTIVAEAAQRKQELPPAQHFTAIAGGGVQAIVNGQLTLIGTPRLLAERGIALTAEEQQALSALQAAGKTIMLVGDGGETTTPDAASRAGQALGLIAVADRIRPTSQKAIAQLQARGIEVALLTGDNRRTADAVARALGVRRVFAEVLPAEKAQYVKQLQADGFFTAMVGDGVNDAPALAQADLGIAIGAGTGVAIETAAVVLMRSDPLDVLAAMRLSAATVRKMKQNLFWAAIYNVVAIPVAAGVLSPFGILLNPAISALAMSASSITVALNAVLLKGVEGRLRDDGQ